MRSRCGSSVLFPFLALACLAGPGVSGRPKTASSVAATVRYAKPRQLAMLANQEVCESSGLAPSRLKEGVFWTHNDSGGGPRLYAFNSKGNHLATYTVTGAGARDWEDMASFEVDGRSFLVIADIGDNIASRKTCTLYVVPEPPVGTKDRPVGGKVRAGRRIDFTYADGPRDCEAVGIDPTSGTICLVSKEGLRCGVYAMPWPRDGAGPTEPLVAKRIATIRTSPVVAMDISPDGRRAIVLNYLDALEFTRGPDETWAAAFARQPRHLPMPRRNQGESICYGRDGKTLYLTSEFAPTPLLEVPVAPPEKGKAK